MTIIIIIDPQNRTTYADFGAQADNNNNNSQWRKRVSKLVLTCYHSNNVDNSVLICNINWQRKLVCMLFGWLRLFVAKKWNFLGLKLVSCYMLTVNETLKELCSNITVLLLFWIGLTLTIILLVRVFSHLYFDLLLIITDYQLIWTFKTINIEFNKI